MKKNLLTTVVEKTNELIKAPEYLSRNRKETSPKSFTRKRKMGFTSIIVFLLNFIKKSLSHELDSYNELMKEEKQPMSKAAFSKARNKISENAFRELFELSSNTAMEIDAFKRFKGHRVFAIDGSQIQLENTKELHKEFSKEVSNKKQSRARASIMCEVLDGVVIDARLASIHTDERSMALKHLEWYEKNAQKNDIIIFDRGYPSHEMIAILSGMKCKYIMRLPKGFNSKIDNSTNKDFYIKIEVNKKVYNVRVIKLELPTGETEVLITNLLRMSFSHSEFVELYFLRWPVETKYNTVKNKLLLETFSGRTPLAIKQDFYATMYLANITAFAKIETDRSISVEQENKELKYKYETNEKMLIGKLKNKLILALICDNSFERQEILDEIIEKASRHRTPLRPNRHFDRGNPSHKKCTAKPKHVI